MKALPFVFVCALGSIAAAASDHGLPPSQFVQTYCQRCHGPEKQKGDLRLDQLPLEQSITGDYVRIWSSALERLSAGEMPPPMATQPSGAERSAMMDQIASKLREAESQKLSTMQPVTFNRLTRDEYANTLHDLLGVTYVPSDPGGLPEEPNWHGFERVGSVLSLSASHVERYLAAAEKALAEAAAPPDAPKILTRWMGENMQLQPDLSKSGEARWPGPNGEWRTLIPPNLSMRSYVGAGGYTLDVQRGGDYVFRVKASGLRPPGGNLPHMRMYCMDLNRTLFDADVEAPEDKPVMREFRAHLDTGLHIMDLYSDGPGLDRYNNAARTSTYRLQFHSIKEGRSPTQQKMTDDDGVPLFPLLIVDYVEIEGPIPPAQNAAFLADAKLDKPAARQRLRGFAEQAFRRPIRDEELERLWSIADEELAGGASMDVALRQSYLATLCSKDCLYLVEGSTEQPRSRLNDWELASRLSYFLWSTMPDAQLFDLARQGKLHEKATLLAELTRLLDDPRAEQFLKNFPREWLQLRNVGRFPPDKKLYPDYSEPLEQAMILEPEAYFRQMVRDNLPLTQFIRSNWTMLNGPLARHYQVEGVNDWTMQRVALKPESHRGGILTSAAVLSLTSDGTRQKPVNRGKWVLDAVFNRAPPPPPPNVGNIQPTPASQPKATVRQKLEAHRSNATCAACHARIDPFGLAFDNYDAIGRWRTVEKSQDGSGADPPIDASGSLIDGRSFKDAEGLKQLLADDSDRFAVAFTEKLATYALRRPVRLGDRESINQIAGSVKEKQYPLRDLLVALVGSDLFQDR